MPTKNLSYRLVKLGKKIQFRRLSASIGCHQPIFIYSSFGDG